MMAIDTNLVRMNPLAYAGIHAKVDEINALISNYTDQKTTIHRLALITIASLVFLVVQVTWDWLVGIELRPTSLSSFSIIFGIYTLCIGVGTLGYWIKGIKKSKMIEEAIRKLVEIPKRKFYGEIVEIRKDADTDPEVLKSLKTILQPCFEKTVYIETNYRLIANHENTVEGETPETFKYTSVKINDNFDEVQSTIGIWRKYYAELLQTKPEIPLIILRVVATQCLQDLPPLKIEDDASLYSCTSPLSEKLGNRNISRKLRGTPKQPISYQTVGQFREYLAEMPEIIRKFLEELPKVKIPAPPDTPEAPLRKSSGSSIVVFDDYLSTPSQ